MPEQNARDTFVWAFLLLYTKRFGTAILDQTTYGRTFFMLSVQPLRLALKKEGSKQAGGQIENRSRKAFTSIITSPLFYTSICHIVYIEMHIISGLKWRYKKGEFRNLGEFDCEYAISPYSFRCPSFQVGLGNTAIDDIACFSPRRFICQVPNCI